MTFNKKKMMTIALSVAILLLPCLIYAQTDFNDDIPDTPIDGGLSLLVASGIGYGINKLKKKNHKKKSDL